MNRVVHFVLMACAIPGGVQASRAAAPAMAVPRTYELMIDGESFEVEANRAVKLQSKQKPGVTYQVAIRVAPVQHLKLDKLRFDYDSRSNVEETRGRRQRSVRLRHELGFSMLLTELGPTLESANHAEMLEIVTESVRKTFQERGVKESEIKVAKLNDHQFEGALGRGVRIRYPDSQGIDHSTLVYVLVGKSFSASCIVEFLDTDGADVLPLVRKTMDSVRGRDKKIRPPR